MSEMLGNRYFIARQFNKAIPPLEEALPLSQNSNTIKKKLIICYIQTGNIERALHYFYDLVKTNPHIITDTDPYYDDCPCGELITKWESKTTLIAENKEFYLIIGMLNLYCDVQKSIANFNKALTVGTNYHNIVSSIIKYLQELEKISP